VLDAVDHAIDANPEFRVLSTGHSLGAALATVAGIELRSLDYTVDIVSSVRKGIMNGRIDANLDHYRRRLHPLEL
jgi:thioesterase domain-containing protein